jgi:hypothetical protein
MKLDRSGIFRRSSLSTVFHLTVFETANTEKIPWRTVRNPVKTPEKVAVYFKS